MEELDNKENALPPIDHCSLKKRPLSPFISKLRYLLAEPRYFEAIHWTSDGRAVIITSIDTFRRLVLDTDEEMFKTRNFTSFVRQLNLYGFRKIPSNGKSDPMVNMQFEHTHFRRDRPDLMHMVHRTCLPNRKRSNEDAIPGRLTAKMTPFKYHHFGVEKSFPSPLQIQVSIPKSVMQQCARLPLRVTSLQSLNQSDNIKDNLNNSCSGSDEVNSSFERKFSESDEESIHNVSLLDSSISDVDALTLEHNYALPLFRTNHSRCNEMDETATYEFLNYNFHLEKEVVQTLVGMGEKELRSRRKSAFNKLAALADVSTKLNLMDMSLRDDGVSGIRDLRDVRDMHDLHEECVNGIHDVDYSIRSKSSATPRETLIQIAV